MPKTNFCQISGDKRKRELSAAIAGNMKLEGITDRKALAKKTKINYNTLSMRLAENSKGLPEEIGNMRLKELWAIADALKFTPEQKARIL